MSASAEKPTTPFESSAPPRVPLDTVREPVSDVREVAPTRPPELDAIDASLARLMGLARRRLGQTVDGRYELMTLLGTGSAGAVYAAWDHREGAEVALKVLHDGLRTSDEHVARFRREARAMSSIGHPGVIEVLDVGRGDDGNLYMAMERLRGQALFYAIAEDRLSDEDIVEIGRQLLHALAAAHASGIVHRDVKPENIFLTHDATGAVQVKLLDFGIAKYLRPEGCRTFSTVDGMLIGTPHYMSPELCRGDVLDEGADLWAAGAVLFHAFAGRPPFDEDHIGRLLMKIVSGRAPSLSAVRPDLPRTLTDAIDRALRRDKGDRWETAVAFAGALD